MTSDSREMMNCLRTILYNRITIHNRYIAYSNRILGRILYNVILMILARLINDCAVLGTIKMSNHALFRVKTKKFSRDSPNTSLRLSVLFYRMAITDRQCMSCTSNGTVLVKGDSTRIAYRVVATMLTCDFGFVCGKSEPKMDLMLVFMGKVFVKYLCAPVS